VQAGYVEDLLRRKITHEIHTSERRSFRGCRRRWKWVFIDNYYPPTTAKPLEFGIAFHVAMETLFNPTTWKFNHLVLGALAEKAFVDTCETQRKKYLANKDEFMLEGEDATDYDELIRLGRGMLKFFVERQLSKLQQEYTPTHVEISFDVPLYVDGKPLLCKCRACRQAFSRAGGGKWFGNPVVYSGRIDMMVRDKNGYYWIWDWKTAAQISDQDMFLELDDQVASYVWALVKAMGLNIRGFIYYELRKAFPEPPKENKTVRLGRKFSVNVNQSTDYETYARHVKQYDTAAYEAGLYDEFLEGLKLNPTVYYYPHVVYKTDYQLSQVETNLTLEALDMIDPNKRIYPQPGRFGCNGCAYQSPCLSKNSGQDFMYTLKTMFIKQEPYYRRTRPLTTDKRGD
jgi:PD-(D/E)XK nuclease superfamily